MANGLRGVVIWRHRNLPNLRLSICKIIFSPVPNYLKKKLRTNEWPVKIMPSYSLLLDKMERQSS
jgi:hypothetical protein